MSEDKKINIIPQAIENALENLTDPPSRGIGNTLSDIWYLIFGGYFGLAAEKKRIKYSVELEKYKKEIEEKILSIPQNKRREADFQLIGQTLDASKFCVDKEEIRKMFVNLLASTINDEKYDSVHPSYAEILKELSRDEALLLKYISENMKRESNRFPLVDIRHIVSEKFDKDISGINIIKIVNLTKGNIRTKYTNMRIEELGLGNIYLNNQTNLGEKANCSKPEKISEYLLNLQRLRIIDIRDRKITGIEEYNNIINSRFVEKKLFEYRDEVFIDEIVFCFIRKYFCLTEYGQDFINCCV